MTIGSASERTAAPPGRAAQVALAAGPELAQLIVVLLWASTFVVTKDAFRQISPLAFLFARFGAMTTMAGAVLLIRRGTAGLRVHRRDLPRFALAGVLGYTLYQLGFVLGLDRTSPFSSSLLIAMVPLFTVVMLALKGEPTTRGNWLGLAVAIAGIVIFLSDQQGGSGSLVGDALSLGGAIAFAGYGIVNRPLVRTYRPETYTFYALLSGTILLLAISAPEAVAQDWGRITWGGWLAIGYMVVLPVYVAYMLWNWAIARRGVAAATSFSLLIPIASGILSAIFFAEGFGMAKLVGAALALLGLVLTRGGKRAGESG